MADFTNLLLALNTGTAASGANTTQVGVVWTNVALTGGAAEFRYSDNNALNAVANASWPFMTRPGAVQDVPYQYAMSADTAGLGYLGTTSGTPITWANSNFNDMQIRWDAVGTFASAPILTAYYTTAHSAVSRGDNDILGGNTTDTGATARSYIKANMYGSGASVQTPAAAAPNAPAATDGTNGSMNTVATAWVGHYQGLMGDVDYITYGAGAGTTPTATTAQNVFIMLDVWTGPNMSTGTKTPVLSVKYTFAAHEEWGACVSTAQEHEIGCGCGCGHHSRHVRQVRERAAAIGGY